MIFLRRPVWKIVAVNDSGVSPASNADRFVRHDPSSLSGRMSVGLQKRSDGVRRDPNGGLAVGPRRSGLSVWIMRLIDDNGECHFLDNRWLWP